MVIVARKDLKLSAGKLAVQVAHAAVSCVELAQKQTKQKRWFRDWYREGQKKVVVKSPDLETLHRLRAHAESVGLVAALITDAGLTHLPPGTVTCLGVGPGPNAEVDRVTGDMSLY